MIIFLGSYREINHRKKQMSDAGTEMRKKHTDAIRSFNELKVAIANKLAAAEIERFAFSTSSLGKKS